MIRSAKTTLAGAAFAVALGGATQAQETVAIAELSWDGQRASSYVIKAVIELRLGGKAEIKKAEAAVVTAASLPSSGSPRAGERLEPLPKRRTISSIPTRNSAPTESATSGPGCSAAWR